MENPTPVDSLGLGVVIKWLEKICHTRCKSYRVEQIFNKMPAKIERKNVYRKIENSKSFYSLASGIVKMWLGVNFSCLRKTCLTTQKSDIFPKKHIL